LASAEQNVVEIVPVFNRPATEILSLLAPLLESTDTLVDNTNSLIVKTTPERLNNLRVLIQQLDVASIQLVISVIHNSHLNANELNAQRTTDSHAINMQGLNADTRELKQQRQFLRTSSGQAAYLNMGLFRQSASGNITRYNNGIVQTDNQTQTQQANTGFMLLPKLYGQEVSIDIEPWSEQLQSNQQMQTQSLHSQFRAKLGEWIEIAGNNDGLNAQEKSGFNTFNQTSLNKTPFNILLKVDRVD
jgi:hypothetical protein